MDNQKNTSPKTNKATATEIFLIVAMVAVIVVAATGGIIDLFDSEKNQPVIEEGERR